MRKFLIKPGIVLLALAGQAGANANAESFVYVNLAPDLRYATPSQDSRITVIVDKGLYGYGHSYGKLSRCGKPDSECLQLDFMALRNLPEQVKVGSSYTEGQFNFKVDSIVTISIAGHEFRPYRVLVTNEGKHSNSYLFDPKIGVLAIGVPNFNSKEIPESVFFLSGEKGIFSRTRVGLLPDANP